MEQVDIYIQYLQQLTRSWVGVPDKPYETPDMTLRSLWFLAKGDYRPIERSIFPELPTLNNEDLERLNFFVELRLSGKPLAYLTGRQVFMGLEMLAGPEALIPRVETEILGQTALVLVKQIIQERGSARVIDLCTGCGNLALALAYYEPKCQVYGSDISGDAITLAQKNARHLGLEKRVEFFTGNLFEPYENREESSDFDLLICNPPYISSRKVKELPEEISMHEPLVAFDGGPFGFNIIFTLISEGPKFLKPNSWIGFEVGIGQGKAIKKRMEGADIFVDIQEHCDDQGNIRTIFGMVGQNDVSP